MKKSISCSLVSNLYIDNKTIIFFSNFYKVALISSKILDSGSLVLTFGFDYFYLIKTKKIKNNIKVLSLRNTIYAFR